MIRFLKKYWPVTGIAFILIVIGFYLLKPGIRVGEDFDAGTIGPEEGLKLENIHYIQDNPDEGVKWILDAGKVRFSENKQSILFDNFELSLSPDSERSIKLRGDSGNYNRSLRELELKGRLRGYTNDGYSIATEHIFFRQDEGTLSSEENIDLAGPFLTVKGRGFRLDIEDMNLKIFNDVTTLIDEALLIP